MRLLITFVFVMASGIAQGQSSCSLVRQLANNLGCDFARIDTVNKMDDFVVRNSFAMDACLVGDKYNTALAQVTGECERWLEQQKQNLGKKYMTGTCRKTCNPCGTGSKCKVDGEAHYKVE